MLALIDADIVVYRVGFAAQKNVYRIFEEEDGAIGEFLGATSNAATAASMESVGFLVLKDVVPDPVDKCLHSAKMVIKSILDEVGTKDYKLYLTGDGNFREEVAVTAKYKGNRTQPKPYHYDTIREYLISVWKAEIINGQEADDAIGIDQCSEHIVVNGEPFYNGNHDTIICSIDKDLNMIPGWHYNFVKKEKYFVEPLEATKFFYMQLLAGDAVDNIIGLYGIGLGKAKKILAEFSDEKSMYSKVLETWATTMLNEHTSPEVAMAVAKDRVHENAQLLWIRRKSGEGWRPPNET